MIGQTRKQLQQQLFPNGIPTLWCPTLTHFRAAATFDTVRIEQHLRFLAPHVHGILVPGSTGEGWVMTDENILELLAIVLPIAKRLQMHVLVGVLKTTIPEMHRCIDRILGYLQLQSDDPAIIEKLQQQAIVGFTVCAPKGKDLTQPEIEVGLRSILDRDLPIALYQLPQVTENLIAPTLMDRLVADYPNLILFKDTSGQDWVAQQATALHDVFLVRGAELHYAQNLKSFQSVPGKYDGFLLSTANSLASQYRKMQQQLLQGEQTAALQLSAQIEQVVQGVFTAVKSLPIGNPFTNANKLLDHLFAHGVNANQQPAPLLYDGSQLPMELVRHAQELLQTQAWLPEIGYLATV